MTKKVLTAEEKFVKENKISSKYSLAKKIDPKLWETITKVEEHYTEYSKNCDAIVKRTLLEILEAKELEGIHSARFRVKTTNSLLVKIISKKAFLSEDKMDDYEIEKYRDLDSSNYYKIITDVSGIRILIRYREQWQTVHNWIWNKFYKGDEYYLKNFVSDYRQNEGKSFVAEKPKVYYRNQKDLFFYEQLGRDIFEFKESDEGYNSIHYLINVDGKYIEIQVRTILDEAWSECTHDVVYKCKNSSKKKELEYLSQCLSQQTIAAEMITNLIYEKATNSGVLFSNKTEGKSNKNNTTSSTDKHPQNEVRDRIKLLEKSEIDFDGNIDSLI